MVMIMPETATTACQPRLVAVKRRTAPWLPQMTPSCILPSTTMASVGGVMLVSPAPGMPTMATG